jgi:hypothetical protein
MAASISSLKRKVPRSCISLDTRGARLTGRVSSGRLPTWTMTPARRGARSSPWAPRASALQRYVEMRVRRVLTPICTVPVGTGLASPGTARCMVGKQIGASAAPQLPRQQRLTARSDPIPDQHRLSRMPPPTARPCSPTASGDQCCSQAAVSPARRRATRRTTSCSAGLRACVATSGTAQVAATGQVALLVGQIGQRGTPCGGCKSLACLP